jgi:hypothetical protein
VHNSSASLEFTSLGDLLREQRAPCLPAFAEAEEQKLAHAKFSATPEIVSFVEEIAMLRLRVVESFERARKRLLYRFAQDVLVRELHLQPVDIEAIARKALDAFAEEAIVSLAVSSADAACLRGNARVCVDERLEPGDLIVDVCDGSFESPLRLRVARTLQETLREEGPL